MAAIAAELREGTTVRAGGSLQEGEKRGGSLKKQLGNKTKKGGESRRVIKRQANGRQGDSASR